MGAFDFSVRKMDETLESLKVYEGKVLLIVNVASFCGYTPQYQGLQELQVRFEAQGFSVLGFPCNQFGDQEPGTETQIAEFCQSRYRVTFPMYGKIDVNGPKADPLFVFLKKEAKGVLGSESVKWNFTKFLVGRDGKVVRRFAPYANPEDLVPPIERALTGELG